jgi:hypothetical protein
MTYIWPISTWKYGYPSGKYKSKPQLDIASYPLGSYLKKQIITSVIGTEEKLEPPTHTMLGKCKVMQPHWETVTVPQKCKYRFAIWLSNSMLFLPEEKWEHMATLKPVHKCS